MHFFKKPNVKYCFLKRKIMETSPVEVSRSTSTIPFGNISQLKLPRHREYQRSIKHSFVGGPVVVFNHAAPITT